MQSRRNFVKKSAQLLVATPLIGQSLLSFDSVKAKKSLKILILGGTSFLGPHQIAYALNRGHKISTFTRGKSKPLVHLDLFDQVEQLIGDREDDLRALEKGEWDVVIDNSGRKTSWTKATANLLKERASLYIYTSSTSVYFPYLKVGVNEADSVLLELPQGSEFENNKISYEYGVMKATSELETIHAFGKDRSIIVRPTFMIGPGDKSDRFIHWPVRLIKGGDILVPGKEDDFVQYIDVRDIAEWMIRLAEENTVGTFNAVGPRKPEGLREFAIKAKSSFNVSSNLVFVDDYEFLKSNNIYYQVPWVLAEGNSIGFTRIDNAKAIKAGLSCRNLQESIKEMEIWWSSNALTQERRDKFEKNPTGLLMREQEVLEKWKEFKQ